MKAVVVGIVCAGLLLAGCSKEPAITGSVTLPESTLDHLGSTDAVLTVALDETTPAGELTTGIVTQTIELSGKDFPVRYELLIREDHFDDANTYSVSANVELSDDILMRSDSAVPVLAEAHPQRHVDIALVPATTD
jgi:uncharacterized lipoprotein YbaY